MSNSIVHEALHKAYTQIMKSTLLYMMITATLTVYVAGASSVSDRNPDRNPEDQDSGDRNPPDLITALRIQRQR